MLKFNWERVEKTVKNGSKGLFVFSQTDQELNIKHNPNIKVTSLLHVHHETLTILQEVARTNTYFTVCVFQSFLSSMCCAWNVYAFYYALIVYFIPLIFYQCQIL